MKDICRLGDGSIVELLKEADGWHLLNALRDTDDCMVYRVQGWLYMSIA